MNVLLVSPDTDLLKLCREVLQEYEGLDWNLARLSPGARPTHADLYIWDSPADVDVAGETDRRLSKHLFLLHRDEVTNFRENLETSEAAILLKPVNKAALSSFLGLAAARFRDRFSSTHPLRTDPLRTDRDEMLQCLIQSNLQLQQYEQDRTNFLTRAVHDLRVPLTATAGYCGLFLGGSLGPLTEEQREVLCRMHHSIQRLSRMASAMFELGVRRHVKRKPDLQPADIREIAEQVLHEIAPLAAAKSISISADLAPQAGLLHLEAGQIEQVLMNLLDNACKFTPKGGTVEVRGYPSFWERRTASSNGARRLDTNSSDSRLPNSYRIDIQDNGPEIPPEHAAKLFEEYTSYSGGKDRSGGGLGLAICKMIIAAHDGDVWMENTELGPRFSFLLPAQPVQSRLPRVDCDLRFVNLETN